ncbi:MAG: hypothetical protein RLZZ511_1206 [Cyanobacteriota bacterium]|jgi:small GTP-binding protein
MVTPAKKICLIGDFAVGKTSLIRQFVDRQFSDQYLSTVGVKLSKKLVNALDENGAVQLMIWDIEGSTAFKHIAPSYFQGAAGAILVGDVTRPETLEHLTEHAQSFLKVNPKSPLIVALNKADMLDRGQLAQLCGRYNFSHLTQWLATYPTSAKDGSCVEQTFQQLATTLIAPKKPISA